MNLDNATKAKILFGLNLLSGLSVDGYKFKSYDIDTDKLVFSNGSNNHELLAKELEKDIDSVNPNPNPNPNLNLNLNTDKCNHKNQQILSETSEINNGNGNGNIIALSETSDFNQGEGEIPQTKQVGGMGKNIFKSSKFSETSSVKPSEISNYSKTSSIMFNERSDKYSDTSVLGQIGGGFETTDTMRSVSELKDRKSRSSKSNSSNSNSLNSNLNMGIFRKIQSGGSKIDVDLKKRMLEVGINSNSSSTSNICE